MSSHSREGGKEVPRLRSAICKRSRSRRRVLQSTSAPSRSKNNTHQHSLTIVVDDDDDHLLLSSPPSLSQAKASPTRRLNSSPDVSHNNSKISPGKGGAATSIARTQFSAQQIDKIPQRARLGLSFDTPIDLTSSNDSSDVLVDAASKQKQKQKQKQKLEVIPEPSKGLELTCAICMDAMKEETSTVCGHIFCRKCIIVAIKTQKKCPTCRRKLSSSSIHRIFLSNSTK